MNIPLPDEQIDYSFALGQARSVFLQDALLKTLKEIDIQVLDGELLEYVGTLRALAAKGLRGEFVFPVPYILNENPFILGYYRLLLGFSQKSFYTTLFGAGRFKAMEEKGKLSKSNRDRLPELCKSMIASSKALITGVGLDRLSRELLDDLTLLTLGPQFRGGSNVKKGVAGIIDVFQALHSCVEHAATSSDESTIEIMNAAGRLVQIQFAPDPDIVIREEMSPTKYRNIIAIEVKAGTDFSNIHNRVGEAEKSHAKAKAAGYVECWTVVNVDKTNLVVAARESPSTNRFYRLSDLKDKSSDAFSDFHDRIVSLTGIRSQ